VIIELNPLKWFKSQPKIYDHVAESAKFFNQVGAPVQALAEIHATPEQPAIPVETHMSFTSILKDIGNGLKKFFTGAVTVATAAEPIIGVLFPGISGLFDDVVTKVGTAEAAAAAAGMQDGTGTQKLAMVLSSVEASFTQWATTNGYVTPNATQIEAAVNAAVAFVNALDSTKATTPTVSSAAAMVKVA
jgi:hypothetical protein